jgi:hypothetical protein
MEPVQFDAMVQRLERESARAPRTYVVKVALLAALGFAILALLVGIAASGLLLLVGVALAMCSRAARCGCGCSSLASSDCCWRFRCGCL